MNKPVAMADVAGASSPAVTGPSGPVVTGMRFLAVAEVYSTTKEVEGDPLMNEMQAECRFNTTEEDVGSHLLEHSGVDKWVCPCDGPTKCKFIAQKQKAGFHPLEHSGVEKGVCPRDGSAEIQLLYHTDIMRIRLQVGSQQNGNRQSIRSHGKPRVREVNSPLLM